MIFRISAWGHKLTDILIGIAQEKGLTGMYGVILKD